MAASTQQNTNARRRPSSLRASFTIMTARYIRPGNVQLLCNFMLRMHHAVAKPVAHLQHHALAIRQLGQGFLHHVQRHPAAHFLLHQIGRRAQQIGEGDGVAVAVGAQGFVQAHVALLLAALPERHENFVFNAARRVGGKRCAGVRVVAAHGLDQPDGADGDKIVKGAAGHLVFAGDVHDEAHVVLNEHLPGVLVAFLHARQRLAFLQRAQGFLKALPAGDVPQQEQAVFDNPEQKACDQRISPPVQEAMRGISGGIRDRRRI